ncbi:SRPBCC domain-containing protein [Arthrobacter sp. JZ12]|nr:SRPBCC domain-containing protein [Arthrobacter sp. JZ12]
MLREPRLVAQWHGWEAEGLGDEIHSIYFAASVKEGADHTSLTVDGGDTFRIQPVTDGTVVTIERADSDTDVTEGWVTFLQQLRFALERHPSGTRRTAFFSAPNAGETIIEKLNAEQLQQPGDSYSLSLPNGHELTGSVWFRSEKQLGLTVSQYADHGEGLVILADQPSSSMAIVSTYGLGANARREAFSAWDAFRQQHYPSSDPLVALDADAG